MKKPFLIAQTPRAGKWNHRDIIPTEISISDSQREHYFTPAAGKPWSEGIDFIAVSSKKLQQKDGREGNEILVLVGVDTKKLSAPVKKQVTERLQQLSSDLEELVTKTINWEKIGGSSLTIEREELNEWSKEFDKLPTTNLVEAKDPIEGVQPPKPWRKSAVYLLCAVGVIAAVFVWEDVVNIRQTIKDVISPGPTKPAYDHAAEAWKQFAEDIGKPLKTTNKNKDLETIKQVFGEVTNPNDDAMTRDQKLKEVYPHSNQNPEGKDTLGFNARAIKDPFENLKQLGITPKNNAPYTREEVVDLRKKMTDIADCMKKVGQQWRKLQNESKNIKDFETAIDKTLSVTALTVDKFEKDIPSYNYELTMPFFTDYDEQLSNFLKKLFMSHDILNSFSGTTMVARKNEWSKKLHKGVETNETEWQKKAAVEPYKSLDNEVIIFFGLCKRLSNYLSEFKNK